MFGTAVKNVTLRFASVAGASPLTRRLHRRQRPPLDNGVERAQLLASAAHCHDTTGGWHSSPTHRPWHQLADNLDRHKLFGVHLPIKAGDAVTVTIAG